MIDNMLHINQALACIDGEVCTRDLDALAEGNRNAVSNALDSVSLPCVLLHSQQVGYFSTLCEGCHSDMCKLQISSKHLTCRLHD